MLQVHDSPAVLAHKLQQIKLLHTTIWAVMAASILALPWLGWFGKFRGAFWLTMLILGECLILGINHGRCPLTDMAARYTDDRACNFDIYLPLWLACNNKRIFGSLFVVGGFVALWRWARRPAL
ncbi:MAG TPA: hypothetical protein VJX69_11300 [Terriglobales bacterium]|nr:hypothetical protein [Terriglobales bacterium]